ncbi:aa3-type cytochrome c oxidase subunit IV [Phenylobacterium sp.]|uniref:aa3-type cytochrome c oxidase subunit IV n=1 Tax=Phenylobacterium sp. TaxID=1871053 RepID=UPI0019C34C42|nr:aa3-type cytochrome c oxidase subunit IV [Phenylobacterium sp.]MBC7166381.1 aa3-type cytochrome c oxidase subunit IV [Phenylobacterium sp.]
MGEQASDYHRGEMDIHEQKATFDLFIGLTKWGSLAVIAGVLFLTLFFCTGAGFIGAAASAVVVTAIGVLVLRAKPEAAAAH